MAASSDLNEAVPVILDVDTGVDDALAILLAIKSPKINVVAMTCVAGNGPIDTVLEATHKVLDASGETGELKVAKGFGRSLIEEHHYCPEIHGKDCLGDLEPPMQKSSREPLKKHAVQHILDTLRDSPCKLSVIALAPLTNIAIAIRMNPALCGEKIERIYWMGGAVKAGGNYSAFAEANAAFDPESAHICFTSGIPITMYPWDAFLDVDFSREELKDLGVIEHGTFQNPAAELSSRLFFREMKQWKKETAVIGDAGVVALVIDPGCVKTQSFHAAVELQGSCTRGMTVVDMRTFVDPPDLPKKPDNVMVVTAVDTDRMKKVYTDIVYA